MSSNPIMLITGANTGLGFESVKSLCKSAKPYTILVSGRSIEKANAAVKEIQAELPETTSVLSTIQIDLEDDESISQAFKYVSEKYGRLDVLVNNGGKSSIA
jgi:NAD(P)-dependent dehydrogenase (short-subunit alcohol dehydrogenase family)